jgi:hypothetical protein
MINKKTKQNHAEKPLSLIEIFILLAGFLAVAYFIGDEFRLVSACPDCPATGVNPVQVLGHPAVPCVDYMAAECLIKKAPVPEAPVPPAQVNPAVVNPGLELGGEQLAADAAQDATMQAARLAAAKLNYALSSIGIALVVGTALGFATYGMFLLFGVDAKLARELGWVVGIGYVGAVAVQSIALGSTFTFATVSLTGVTTGFFANAIILSGPAVAVAAVLALLYWIFIYRDERYVAVVYTCSAWEPPSGGTNCRSCNNGPLPCTEYKCKSLGSTCELLNPTDPEDKYCDENNRLDIVPAAISSNAEVLLNGFNYTPSSATLWGNGTDSTIGVTINYTGEGADGTGCIPTYKLFTYGITLDKPARCKVDTSIKSNYSDMRFKLSEGKSKYNHTIFSYYENASVEVGSGWVVQRSGERYELHVRCNSTSGRENLGTFVFKYCIQPESNRLAPRVVEASPANNTPVKKGQDTKNISLYVDKPSECRWSRNSQDSFDDMAITGTNMSCSTVQTVRGVNIVYKCDTSLNGLVDETNNMYYFSCKSFPGREESLRKTNEQPYVYSLIGTKGLIIEEVSPDERELVRGSTINVNTTINVRTAGGFDNGKAICVLKSDEETLTDLVKFDQTGGYDHTKKLWIPQGNYNYYIECCDAGLNCDNRTINFEVESDISSPKIIRIGSELASGKQLKIITNEKAECVYGITSCSYKLDEGVKFTTEDSLTHFTEWDTDNNIYVKCKDEFTNQPAYDECTAIIRPFSLL